MSGNSTLVLVLMVGSRFSSRLRREPGSGGGDKRVGTRPPGADGSGHRGQRSVVLARGGCGIGGTGRDLDGGACTRGQQVLGQGHRPDHDEQFRSPGARGLSRDHQQRLSKLQSGLQGAGFRRWYPECGHRPAQLRGTRRGPGTPGEGECHGGRSPVPVAAEGGGEDRRARGVVTLPGPQISSPVPDGPTACPHPGPTTPEERSAAREHTPVDERARKRGNGHDYLQEVGRRPRHPPIINGIPHASSADAPTMANRRSAGKYFSK